MARRATRADHRSGVRLVALRAARVVLAAQRKDTHLGRAVVTALAGRSSRTPRSTTKSPAQLRFDSTSRYAPTPFLQQLDRDFKTYRSPGQRAAVRSALVAPPGSTLVVNLPTGGGKTLALLAPSGACGATRSNISGGGAQRWRSRSTNSVATRSSTLRHHPRRTTAICPLKTNGPSGTDCATVTNRSCSRILKRW